MKRFIGVYLMTTKIKEIQKKLIETAWKNRRKSMNPSYSDLFLEASNELRFIRASIRLAEKVKNYNPDLIYAIKTRGVIPALIIQHIVWKKTGKKIPIVFAERMPQYTKDRIKDIIARKKRIAIVDDTIATGKTMERHNSFIAEINPDAEKKGFILASYGEEPSCIEVGNIRDLDIPIPEPKEIEYGAKLKILLALIDMFLETEDLSSEDIYEKLKKKLKLDVEENEHT